MFAVYDGHGQYGHDCARFAQKKLPAAVAKFVKQQRVQKYNNATEKKANNNHSSNNTNFNNFNNNKKKKSKKKLFDPDKWPLLTQDEYMECCRKAFWDVNRHMNAATSVSVCVCVCVLLSDVVVVVVVVVCAFE